MNRLRRFEMGYPFFEEFLKLGGMAPCCHIASTNMPSDMEIVEVRNLPFRRVFEILVRSDSFDELPEGATPPIWEPLYSRLEVIE